MRAQGVQWACALALLSVTLRATSGSCLSHEETSACDSADESVDATVLLQSRSTAQMSGSARIAPCLGPVVPVATPVLTDFPRPGDDVYMPGYRFTFIHDGDTITFEVVKGKGGLIQAFALNNRSIVLNRPLPQMMDGSTFWPSPQAADRWGSVWPPPKRIDVVPSISAGPPRVGAADFSYSAEVDGDTLTLTSEPSSRVKMVVKKHIIADQDQGAMVLDYEMHNINEAASPWAPWEITRVPPNGLTFFATGETLRWQPPKFSLVDVDGVSWFMQNSSAPMGGKYIGSSSANFLAHTDGVVLLTKCFHRITLAEAAPGEGQIELYNGGEYVEVEPQGPFATIPAGGSAHWRVMWFLRRMPPGAKMAVGDPVLAKYARSLCAA